MSDNRSPDSPALSTDPTATALFGRIPRPYGQAEAVGAAGSTAAPLLAGFALTIATLIIQSPSNYRWPGPAIVLLCAAVVIFIMVVQYAFWARHFYSDFATAVGSYPDQDEDYRKQGVQEELTWYLEAYERWAARTRLGYRIGLLLLLVGSGVAFWPLANEAKGLGGWRALVVIIFGAGAVYEILWFVAARLTRQPVEATGAKYKLMQIAWFLAPSSSYNKPSQTLKRTSQE